MNKRTLIFFLIQTIKTQLSRFSYLLIALPILRHIVKNVQTKCPFWQQLSMIATVVKPFYDCSTALYINLLVSSLCLYRIIL